MHQDSVERQHSIASHICSKSNINISEVMIQNRQLARSINLIDFLIEINDDKKELFQFILDKANSINMNQKERQYRNERTELQKRRFDYIKKHSKKRGTKRKINSIEVKLVSPQMCILKKNS